MSRVANKPIPVSDKITVTLQGQAVTVKGPKGELSYSVHPMVSLSQDQDNKNLLVKANNNTKQATAQAGTTRANVNNMVAGVEQGFKKSLKLVGVGYRVQVQGQKITLSLGKSHPDVYELPNGVTATAPSNTELDIESISKQQVGQIAAEIRAFRPPEPYKGKGVMYKNEQIVRKEAKKK